MLRNLQVKPNKPVDATYKAEVQMITGMGVVKDYVNHTVQFPIAETADNIYFVDKEKNASGIYAGNEGYMSDYDEQFTTIKSNELVKIHEPESGERRAVDQYIATGLSKGVAMSVGTDGKWKKAGTDVKSRYIYDGTHTSDGHVLAVIDIVNETIANA